MKNVLIASTYFESKGENANDVWFKLQKKFIQDNTINYDFAVYLNMVSNRKIFKDCIIIGENDTPNTSPSLSHRIGLRASIDFFRENRNHYDTFCILDSDCFPVRKGWLKDTKQKLRENNLKFAAVLRLENGELFPHPSGIIIPREFIEEDIFAFPDNFDNTPTDVVDNTKNVINGNTMHDTGTNMTFWDNDGKLQGYPLVRSNVWNLHPLYAGIYGDIFYHNGFGSRFKAEPDNLFRTKTYWDLHRPNSKKDFSSLFEGLKKSPQKFIEKLRGENKPTKFDLTNKTYDFNVPFFNP